MILLNDVDYAWGSDLRPAQDFAEEALGCSSASGLVQKEIECLAGGIDSSIQIHPLSLDLHIGFINAPRIVGLLQIRSAAFIYFWGITLNPAVDGGMVQR